MTLSERIAAFESLGKRISSIKGDELDDICRNALDHNSWFTPNNVVTSLKGLENYLNKDALSDWASQYTLPDKSTGKKIGVVMAGNIPLAGFHDFLSVLMAGHTLVAKLSSQDPYLLKLLFEILIDIEPGFSDKVHFEDRLNSVDAIIATGSDNSSRYFDYYFAKYPHIIRKNRSSCAILHGKEPIEELQKLESDIFTYYGLGCRNISKVFLPEGSIENLLHALEKGGKEAISHHKYSNNYDYNKSILLVNREPHFDNGFLMMKESTELVSPVSVLFYEYYSNGTELELQMQRHKEKIQCTVSENGWYKGSLPFGQAQFPGLMDYADGVDTMAFLQGL